ncbi:MAG: sigma-70 family RNA polymerase sigma factor [Bacteroidetes bacterium]|nr:MAG: sigma-70 family RNA polymerase sigma factor [Bacteroidota bacterium]
MASTISDETLIQQAIKGRQSACAMLVKRYEKYVFTLVLRMVKNREDADEVAQDCFLRMFRYLPEFRGDCKFTTWLYKIVYSTSLNHLRKKNLDTRSLDDAERPIDVADESTLNAAASMEREDRNAALQEAIDMLSPDDANIITLFYLYEQNLEEICQVMDLTMTNAKTKLCRARQRLKTVIDTRFSAQIREST